MTQTWVNNQYLYAGGLAEIIAEPTELTFSYLRGWFIGTHSLGAAAGLLGMPHSRCERSLLVYVDGELYVDLKAEEETLYRNSIFEYLPQESPHQTPKMHAYWRKCISVRNLTNTFRMLMKQASWVANPTKNVDHAKILYKKIAKPTSSSLETINTTVREEVMPYVLAIGYLCEFYHQVVQQHPIKEELEEINAYISREVAKRDWFFRSVADQQLVQEGQLSFTAYMEKYGMRADKDYELACPRWHEISGEIKKRISDGTWKNHHTQEKQMAALPTTLQANVDALIELLILRSEARKKTLEHLNNLRHALGERKHSSAHSELMKKKKQFSKETPENKKRHHGNGIAVSSGIVKGTAVVIKNTSQRIPTGSIGIFPNASPEFATQFPKCLGLIFLQGGQTSHGAIVAREFAIPALIDASASFIPAGTKVEINGGKGSWKVL